jgi:hypothetical protein
MKAKHQNKPSDDAQRKLRDLQNQIDQLQASVASSKSGHVNSNNNNVNNHTYKITNNLTNNHTNNNVNITQNCNIIVNGFGKEATDHISLGFLDQCLRRRDKGLIELIEKIHFDPERLENRNMQVTSRKDPMMIVHNGLRWKYEMKDSVLKQLVDKGHSIMQEHYGEHEERLRTLISQTMFACIQEWMDKMQEEDKKTVSKVIDALYLLILNATMDASVHVKAPA